MYQPRRVVDPIAPADPAVPAAPQRVAHTPRYAAPTLGERMFAKGSVALAVVTASATAGAVVIGGSSDPAAAAAGTAAAAAPAVQAVTVAEVAPLAPTLTAKELATPSMDVVKVTAKALYSLTPMYTKGSVNVRKKADQDSGLLGRLDLGVRVSATSEIKGKYRKVEYGNGYGWVLRAQLSDSRPPVEAAAAAGTTRNACKRGSRVESRLRQDTVHIYRSVCALFPAVNSYGGWRAGGLPFHRNGRALDIMVTPRAESALGHRIAKYLIKHAKQFNIDHIIFEQHIWTPSTPRWRKMADRGSLNANHFNHVHVAIRG